MVALVEVGEGGVALLVSNELLKQHETRDRKAVGEACLAALEKWSITTSFPERAEIRAASLASHARSLIVQINFLGSVKEVLVVPPPLHYCKSLNMTFSALCSFIWA
jgi:hypothetical protein